MKYKKYIWIFFIFALTIGIAYFIQRSHSSIEGFMTEDEYITEAFNRIKAIQTIKASINASLDAFDKSVKDTCDLTPKYRDVYVAARTLLPEYASLTTDERQKNARADYDEERLTVISSGTPIYECFANQADIENATRKLESEMKELSDLMNSRRLRTMIQKGKLLTGLQILNSTFSGTKLVSEGFIDNMVREDLLESADSLIKEARKIQTISRTVVTNTLSLSTDLGKIPEFVRNRNVEKYKEKKSQIYSDLINDDIVTQLLGPNKYLQLLYKASRDGYRGNTFHQKVNNQGSTLTVFRTTTGRTAGGYNPISWKSVGKWLTIEKGNAFLFNVIGNNVNKFFNKNNIDYSIYDTDSYLAIFGGGNDLRLYEDATVTSQPYTYLKNDSELFGKNSAEVTEIEVFKVS
jgi:hypothetical protein